MDLIRHGLGRRLLVAALCAVSVSCATPPPVPPPAAVQAGPERPTLWTFPAAPVPEPECRLAAVGDIMLGGTAAPEMRKYGYDYPFELTKDILKQAQIVFGNLEGPLTDGGASGTVKQYVFPLAAGQGGPGTGARRF